jgi:hypothetical protein
MALRLRRGTDLERQAVVFAEGELVYTTDTKSLYVGDGQTLGGILISGDLNESPNALTRNLDLNSYDITGSGDISVSGVITANQFVGDGRGLTNLPTLDVAEGGFYSINIVGSDSTVIVNRETNTFTGALIGDVDGSLKGNVLGEDSSVIVNASNNEFYGNFIGDGSGLFNLPLSPDGSGVILGSSYRINIVGDDSSVIINSQDSSINSSNINAISIIAEDSVVIGNSNNLLKTIINTNDSRATHIHDTIVNDLGQGLLTINRAASNSFDNKLSLSNSNSISTTLNQVWDGNNYISGSVLSFLIDGDVTPGNAPQRFAIIVGDGDGDIDLNSGIHYRANQKVGIMTSLPDKTLDVNGDSVIRGDLTVEGFVQFGSYTDAEISLVVPTNGMVYYNSTANRFRGFQNNTWINLDDGSIVA